MVDQGYQGTTHFGDGLYDEWFIVWILFELSKKFDVLISVVDGDGQFLLIEAADHLEKEWDPEMCDDRVYIYQGQLHMIPLEYPSDAQLIGSIPTLAPLAIQQVIQDKIKKFPNHQDHSHYCTVLIPRLVGQVLLDRPQLMAAAVQSFYTRDPVSMKPVASMKVFDPRSSIDMTVQMNRVMYAQLASASMVPPPKFTTVPSHHCDFKKRDIGMKIAIGFEILYHSANASELNEFDFEKDAQWKKMKQKLEKLGYFKNEIQGSQNYGVLEREAQLAFWTSIKKDVDPAQELVDFVQQHPLDHDIVFPVFEQDADAWMFIDPSTIDAMMQPSLDLDLDLGEFDDQNDEEYSQDFDDLNLKGRFNSKKDIAFNVKADSVSDGVNQNHTSKEYNENNQTNKDEQELNEQEKKELEELSKLFGHFNSFVEKESDFRGALFPHESDDDSESDLDPVEFNQDTFLQSLKDHLGIQEEWEPLEQVMQEMDEELATTSLANDFEKDADQVDLDMNLVKNIMSSVTSQEGLAGPATNLLGSMGWDLSKR